MEWTPRFRCSRPGPSTAFLYSLKLWIAIGGEGLLWLRAVSGAFLSVTAVVPFVLLCRQLKLRLPPAGGLALLFFAVNGSLIKYSREVRMYSLLLLLSLASIWLFVRFVKSGKGLGLLAVADTCLFTHIILAGWWCFPRSSRFQFSIAKGGVKCSMLRRQRS